MARQPDTPPDGAWSKRQLLRAERDGRKLPYICFWGHTPRPDGRLDKYVLSQWYPAPFALDGVRYETAEHYMMAAKARLFEDSEVLELILDAASPKEAKFLGRRVRGFDNDRWNAIREDVVFRASVGKFSSEPSLRQYLLSTRDAVLVEASPKDKLWGVGLGPNNPNAVIPSKWRGKNLLGFALMKARAELRNR